MKKILRPIWKVIKYVIGMSFSISLFPLVIPFAFFYWIKGVHKNLIK